MSRLARIPADTSDDMATTTTVTRITNLEYGLIFKAGNNDTVSLTDLRSGS